MKRIHNLALMLILSLAPSYLWAGAVITYHGRILDTARHPVESNNVTFRVRVYSPNPGKCLMYEEVRTFSMADSGGVFAIPIGDGAGSRTALDPGIVIEKIFANDPSFTFNTTNTPKLTCNSGVAYTPSALDQRQLVVSFDDHSGVGEQTLPIMDINFVPFSVSAYDTQNVGGTPANSVLRVNGGNATPLSVANFTELINLITGASLQYEKVGKLNGQAVPILTNGQVLGWNGGGWSAITPMTSYTETDPSVKAFAKANLPACGANAFLQNDGAGNLACVTVTTNAGTLTSIGAGTGLITDKTGNMPITDNGILSVDVGTGANQIVQMGSDGKLPIMDGSKLTNVTASGLSSTASISTSGNIATSGNLSTTGTLSATTITNTNIYTDNLYIRSPAAGGNQIRITGPTTPIAANYVLKLPEALPSTGTTQVLASDDSGNLSWVAQSAGSVTSVTANAPLAVDSSIAASPKVTIQKADATHDGYLSQSDWSAFNNKQPAGNYITTSATAADDQKFLKFVNGSGWEAHYVKLSELKNALGTGAAFDVGIAGCTSAQTLVWTSLTDQFKCQDISLPAGKVTGLATVATSGSYNDLADKPAIPTCGANQYLTFNGTTFTCANDAGASGTVASLTSGTSALTFSSSTGAITANISDATTAAKGLVQLAANGGTTTGTVVQADDSRLADSRAPSGAAGGDLTGNYPNPTLTAIVAAGTGTKVTYDAKGRVTASTSLAAGDIPALDWSKITTGKPTTLSGYGIGDAVKNGGGTGTITSGADASKSSLTPATGDLYVATDTQKIYRYSGSGWDLMSSASGSGGTLTSVTADAPLAVDSSVATSPKVTIQKSDATHDGYLSQADWSTFNGKQAAGNYITTLTGDVSSSLFVAGSVTTSVDKIKGIPVSAAPTLSGQVLRYQGGNLVPAFVSMQDLRSQVTGSQALPAICNSSQTLTFDSATDSLACSNISITKSQISDLGSQGSLSALTAATTANSMNNGDYAQTWNWALTSASKSALKISENTASTGGSGSQFLLDVGTIASSTANPIRIQAQGNPILNVSNSGAVTLNTSPGTGGSQGSAMTLTAGQGGPSDGKGGNISITGGIGGSTAGPGGDITLAGGAGIANSRRGGFAYLQSGVGGSGGGGGDVNIMARDSGTLNIITENAAVNNPGGDINITAGAGYRFAGSGGRVTITAGAARADTIYGDGGPLILKSGAAAAGAVSAGGPITMTAANGSSSGAGGNGGSITITAGNAGGTGANNGGSITLAAGTKTSTGTAGSVNVSVGNFNVVTGSAGIGTSNPTATLDVNGHIGNSQATGSLSVTSCGNGTISGNDTRGIVTLGSTGVTSCQINFSQAYATAPYCVVGSNSGGTVGVVYVSSTSTTSLVLGFTLSTSSAPVTYICIQ